MTGGYLEMQTNGYIIGPIIAFRKYIFRDVLSAFGNLDRRAEVVANEYYNRIAAPPAGGDCDIDMADVAEAAHDKSLSWYLMRVSLRQSMMNLLAAGLFHLTEQQLAVLCRDAGFTMAPPRDTKMNAVKKWYNVHLGLDLEALPSWGMFNELRLVANAVKHAEGAATRQLRALRPELFSNPDFEDIYTEFEEKGIERTTSGTATITGSAPGYARDPILAPLSSEEFFVSEKLLRIYAEAAEPFFAEIADHFKAHRDDPY